MATNRLVANLLPVTPQSAPSHSGEHNTIALALNELLPNGMPLGGQDPISNHPATVLNLNHWTGGAPLTDLIGATAKISRYEYYTAPDSDNFNSGNAALLVESVAATGSRGQGNAIYGYASGHSEHGAYNVTLFLTSIHNTGTLGGSLGIYIGSFSIVSGAAMQGLSVDVRNKSPVNAVIPADGAQTVFDASVGGSWDSYVTFSVASPTVVTWPGHLHTTNTPVQFTPYGGHPTDMPAGVNMGQIYYMNVIDADHFNIATTLANLAAHVYVNVTGAALVAIVGQVEKLFGNAYMARTNNTPGAINVLQAHGTWINAMSFGGSFTYADSIIKFPVWKSWVPTFAPSVSGAFTTITVNRARYLKLGTLLLLSLDITVTNHGSGVGNVNFTHPEGLVAAAEYSYGSGRDVTDSGKGLELESAAAGYSVIYLTDASANTGEVDTRRLVMSGALEVLPT